MSRRSFSLFSKLPKFEELSAGASPGFSSELILDRFLADVAEKGLELYPAQEEAILALVDGQNVILNTPTGSGKSLVAMALHFYSLALGRRSVYTCPIKALVNEKFLQLCKEFGPEQVGMMTGDGSVNRDAPILCCTAEILANMALQEGEWAKVDDIVMDEFHYYSDRERGVGWQIPLLTLKRARFLLMSATLGEMDFFKRELDALTGRETVVISRLERPVPLSYEYSEKPLHETVKELIDASAAPIYLVNFTQREAAEEAQNLMSVDFLSKEQKREIAERLFGVSFSSPYGKEIQKFLKHGVGLHHAGLLPKYRMLVEKLAQDGLLKVISGTDTLGVGVNIPIRTVLFSKLCKFDGEKTAILSNRDFHQISGRAGRKGFDDRGRVVAQAPQHVIENLRLEAKAKADPKKAKKIVRAKPPERGYVHFDKATFERLVAGAPEPLQSRFAVSHGMILNVLGRERDDGCRAMRELIRHSHESESHKVKHRSLAWQLFRSLVDRGIIEILPKSAERRLRVNVALQEDFSLNQTLALWLIDTLALLDPASETYALDVLTLVESILESPDLILRKQVDRLKTQRMREMKEEGLEYEQRIEELEKIEHPKPMRDFIYSSFNAFADVHPWVGSENIRPKSIAREMVETYQSFAEYVREYDLQRAEGILLRYLSDVYRALLQTVPDQFKTEEVDSIVEYFGSIVRSIDSSLVDEWERLKHPEREFGRSREAGAINESAAQVSAQALGNDFLANQKAVRIALMNEIFRLLRTLATGNFEESISLLASWQEPVSMGRAPIDGSGEPWTAERLASLAQAYGDAGHEGLRTDPGARAPKWTRIQMDESEWLIEQTLCDFEGHNDWHMRFSLDTAASRATRKPVLRLLSIEEISVGALG